MEFKYPAPDIHLYKTLLDCYRRCLRNKRHLKRGRFHLHHEFAINKLCLDIESNTYHPGMSSVFVVLSPKPREVVAASLRDRIVHHYIYQYMLPYWERRFATGSYACRPGRGPLKASLELRDRLRRHRLGSGNRPLWYLKVDVSSFFPSIDKEILFTLIKKHMMNRRMLKLCEVTLFHPMARGQFRLTCPKELWELVPRRKSLFYAPPGKGLPIGNLSSQFWANIYMNVLDQWIMRRFKGKILYWQRYVDDVLFLAEIPEVLAPIVAEVDAFLGDQLKLRLNPRKTLLQPLSRGLDHLGYFHRQGSMQIRRSVVKRAKLNVDTRMSSLPQDLDELIAVFNSYCGGFGHGDSYRLRSAMARRVLTGVEASRMRVDALCRKMEVTASSAEEIRADRGLQKDFMRNFVSPPWESGTPDRALNYLLTWQPIADFLVQEGSGKQEGARA